MQLRGQIEYLSLYHLRSERLERALKVFLAVTSSGSISAWVIWKQFHIVWAALIAASQFVNVIKTYLPYGGRLRRLREVTPRLDGLFLSLERTWQRIADGELTNGEISVAIEDFKRRKLDIVDAHLGAAPLPVNSRLCREAAAETEKYFESIYGIGGPSVEEE